MGWPLPTHVGYGECCGAEGCDSMHPVEIDQLDETTRALLDAAFALGKHKCSDDVRCDGYEFCYSEYQLEEAAKAFDKAHVKVP